MDCLEKGGWLKRYRCFAQGGKYAELCRESFLAGRIQELGVRG